MGDCCAYAVCLCLCCFLVSPIVIIICYVFLHPAAAGISIETALLTHAVNLDRNLVDVKLTANVDVRNPSRRLGVYYERVEAVAYYKGARLRGSGAVPPFYVGHKRNAMASAVFWGESCYDCTDPGRLDGSTGWFDVDLWICPDKYKYKLGRWTLTDYNDPTWRCNLTLRLVANKTVETKFTSNPCHRPMLSNFDYHGC